MLVATAAIAWASSPTRTVYVQVRNARVFAKPSPRAAVLKVLQPGAEVGWVKPVRGADLPWQMVRFDRKHTGYVLGSALSVTKPELTLKASDARGRAAAAAMGSATSSGDAVKALGPGAEAYSQQLDHGVSAAQIDRAEAIAKKVTSRRVRRHALAVGLPSTTPVASRRK